MTNPIEQFGYKAQTTFWMDFSIADRFGCDAIRDTYKRAMEGWKDNHIYLTELVMVLNHKIWQWYEKNDAYAEVYNELWEKADNYALEHLKGEELTYFLQYHRLRRANAMKALYIDGRRNGYGPDQCGETMTVGELIEFLQEFDEGRPVYLRNDNGYTYGNIDTYSFTQSEDLEGEEDENE